MGKGLSPRAFFKEELPLPASYLCKNLCLFRKAGIHTMTIKNFGKWESLEMVEHIPALLPSMTA